MIVSEVKLIDSGLTSTNSQSATYTQVFRVKLEEYTYANNFLLNQLAEFFIMGDSQIPQDYDKLDLSAMTSGAYLKSTFRCTDRDIKMVHSGDAGADSLFSIWRVTITYTANIGIVTGAVTAASRLISINRGFQPYDFTLSKSYNSKGLGDEDDDIQGDPTKIIQNSAGDPPSEGLTTVRNISWIEMELEYLDEYFDKEWLSTSFNTINRFVVDVCDYKIPEFGGKLTLKDAQQIISGNGQIYWVVKVLLEMKEEGWITEWLDAGFNVLDDELNSTPILQKDINPNITGDKGEEKVSDAQKLDGFGELNPEDEDPIYNEDLMTFAEDWGHLDLPISLMGE